jgi:6-pyruvoyltetrahydropterin/6-carboxytetrahydropterin synthase
MINKNFVTRTLPAYSVLQLPRYRESKKQKRNKYMFEICTEAHFSAAHHLINYNGPCENVHGHNWLVKIVVRCDRLNALGIGIDFKTLRKDLKDILTELDHADLNIIFDARGVNPSSEQIARYIYKAMEERLEEPHCSLYRVDVYETPGNCASYFEYA